MFTIGARGRRRTNVRVVGNEKATLSRRLTLFGERVRFKRALALDFDVLDFDVAVID